MSYLYLYIMSSAESRPFQIQMTSYSPLTPLHFVIKYFINLHQTCDIQAEGAKRTLTLKNVQRDQAGEVSYQALNAETTAMLTVNGKRYSKRPTSQPLYVFYKFNVNCRLF